MLLLPRWLVGEHLRAGTLITVMDDYQVSPSTIESALYAVYPHRDLSPKVRLFIDFLVEHLAA